MSWLGAAIIILVIALALQLGLVAYAMYALVGVILLSRWLTRRWGESLSAQREINRVEVDTGDQVAVVATIKNEGSLSVPWMLLEDLLPLKALVHRPPNLKINLSPKSAELRGYWRIVRPARSAVQPQPKGRARAINGEARSQ